MVTFLYESAWDPPFVGELLEEQRFRCQKCEICFPAQLLYRSDTPLTLMRFHGERADWHRLGIEENGYSERVTIRWP